MLISDLEKSGEWIYQYDLYVCESVRRPNTFTVNCWISNKDDSELFTVSDESQEILDAFTDYESARIDAENWAESFEVHTGE